MSASKIFIIVLVVLIGLYALYSFYWKPEAQVKRAIMQAKKGVETEDYDAIESFFALDFKDQFGFTKDNWMEVIRRSLDQWKDIDATLFQLEIQVDDKQATANFHVRGEATRASTLEKEQFPDRQTFGYRNVTFNLIKQEGKWRLSGWSNVNSNTWQIPMPEVAF